MPIPNFRISDELLSRMLRVPLDPSIFQNDNENQAERTVFLLGGGGAKGCFQAGALGFLAHTGREEFKPNLICGTSVGAVNGILAMETAVTDDSRRTQDLLRIWRSLRWKTDFFINSLELERVDESVPDLLENLVGYKATDIGSALLGPGYTLHDSEKPRYGGLAGGGSATNLLYLLPYLLTSPIGAPITLGVVLAGIFIGAGLFEDAKDVLNAQSLYTLSPLVEKMKAEMNLTTLATNLREDGPSDLATQVKLGQPLMRMVSVDVGTGKICWVDDRARFNVLQTETWLEEVLDEQQQIVTYDSIYGNQIFARDGVAQRNKLNYLDTLIAGVLGSAAIPMAFPPQDVSITEVPDYEPSEAFALYDGGLKDVVPTQASEDYLVECDNQGLSALVITIANQPLFRDIFKSHNRSLLEDTEHPDTYNPLRKYWNLSVDDVKNTGWPNAEGTNLLELIIRATLNIQQEEIGRSDNLDLLALKLPFDQLTICPSFQVNDTGQIDQGLTDIAIDYGWMRACDIAYLKQRRQEFADGVYPDTQTAYWSFFEVMRTSDLITRLRMNCWRLEQRCTPRGHRSGYDDDEHFRIVEVRFEEGVIDLIRETKHKIADQISERNRLLRDFEYPAYPTAEFSGGRSIQDWLDFERHSLESYWFSEDLLTMIEDQQTKVNEGSSESASTRLELMTTYRQELHDRLLSEDLWGPTMIERERGAIAPAIPPAITS